VRVQLSDHQRHQLQSLYALTIKTGNESYVPLHLLAEFEFNYGFTTISRRDGKRVITINANVEPIRSLPKIIQTIDQTIIPTLQAQFQGVSIEYRGKQKDTSDGMKALSQAFVIVLIIIYATLAIPFQSYAQPILIMIAIPFGVIGALLGHMIMGYGLSVVSVMGIVALSGVVINDALVLIEYANRRVREGVVAFEAIVLATKRRFRPVLLTTITTFGGLAPMIFETSVQARFLIPMAVSLGFGILFATFITLLLIPALYIILDDVQQLFKKLKHNV
jgi:multidrug efflux pump subunit AcrB